MQVLWFRSSFTRVLGTDVVYDGFDDGRHGIGRDAGKEGLREHDGVSIVKVVVVQLAELVSSQGGGIGVCKRRWRYFGSKTGVEKSLAGSQLLTTKCTGAVRRRRPEVGRGRRRRRRTRRRRRRRRKKKEEEEEWLLRGYEGIPYLDGEVFAAGGAGCVVGLRRLLARLFGTLPLACGPVTPARLDVEAVLLAVQAPGAGGGAAVAF